MVETTTSLEISLPLQALMLTALDRAMVLQCHHPLSQSRPQRSGRILQSLPQQRQSAANDRNFPEPPRWFDGINTFRSDSESEAPEISEDELEDIALTPPPRSRRGARKEASPDDQDTFENPYPIEGKYKNEEDRERLMSMAEIEREEVLYQRSEEMQRLKEKRDLAALVRTQIKDQPRRSGREGQLRSEKAGKRDELSELKKRREEKSNAAKVKVVTT